MKRIILAAGGTGGHLFPALSVGKRLKEDGIEVYLLGNGKEEIISLFREEGIGLVRISAPCLPSSVTNICPFLFRLFSSFFVSFIFLIRKRPNLVIGFGSYASFPVLSASLFLHIPLVLCEQNLLPGLVTRIFSPFSSLVCLSFTDTKRYVHCRRKVITGNPVREEIVNQRSVVSSQKSVEKCREKLGLVADRFTVLILGGSLGAHRINLGMIGALDYLEEIREFSQFIHLSGEKDYSLVFRNYQKSNLKAAVFPFFQRMELAYASADLVISRAGATTIAEITAIGLPSILIPYPYAKGGHQKLQGEYLSVKGASILIEDKELSGKIISKTILPLFKNKERLKRMAKSAKDLGRPEATEKIISLAKSWDI